VTIYSWWLDWDGGVRGWRWLRDNMLLNIFWVLESRTCGNVSLA